MILRAAIAILLGAAVLLAIGSCERAPPQPIREPARHRPPPRPIVELLRVEGTREIAPGQTITVLRVPDPAMPGLQILDTYCLIYEHHTYRQAQVVCRDSRLGRRDTE